MEGLSTDLRNRIETDFVKFTYERIAQDFSATRYKKWPKVEAFLQSLPKDSLVLDAGCGNGKYLDLLPFAIGSDISSQLLSICRKRGFETVRCDIMRLPFISNTFDAIICIATLHHIVTSQRRQRSLENMIDLLTPHTGRLLVQVWAFEQNFQDNNPYLKNSTKTENSPCQTVNLDDQIKLSVHKNRTPFAEQDLLVPFHVKSEHSNNASRDTDNTHLRYYHVYREKELDSMFDDIPQAQILDSYYDKGNWCVIVTKKLECL